jgi:hypothetical protein
MIGMDIAKIGCLIHTVRGQRVMLDEDLARMYGVRTRRLNEQVRRNLARFPEDFMFRLTPKEHENLKSQIATSSSSWGGRRKPPLAFTQEGVAMLSSVLNSERAIRVNIEIMRAFVSLRRALSINKELAGRMEKVEKRLGAHDIALKEHAISIHSVFEEIRRLMREPGGPRKRIGF